ncbi:MAG: glycoside hydrolase family 3 N-terminal domain-containing protein [Sphingomonadales bacterium]
MEEVGRIIGLEARSIGCRQGLAPVLDVARDARWGRTEETFGEDPYLASQMAIAFVRPLEAAGVVCTPVAKLSTGLKTCLIPIRRASSAICPAAR